MRHSLHVHTAKYPPLRPLGSSGTEKLVSRRGSADTYKRIIKVRRKWRGEGKKKKNGKRNKEPGARKRVWGILTNRLFRVSSVTSWRRGSCVLPVIAAANPQDDGLGYLSLFCFFTSFCAFFSSFLWATRYSFLTLATDKTDSWPSPAVRPTIDVKTSVTYSESDKSNIPNP